MGEILNLPEQIAKKTGKHIVICIDEFQQIGEMPDSLTIQKKLRSIWQLQQNVSYCLFERFNLGTKSNIARLHTSLIERELIESIDGELYIMDPVFEQWFKRSCM